MWKQDKRPPTSAVILKHYSWNKHMPITTSSLHGWKVYAMYKVQISRK